MYKYRNENIKYALNKIFGDIIQDVYWEYDDDDELEEIDNMYKNFDINSSSIAYDTKTMVIIFNNGKRVGFNIVTGKQIGRAHV